MTHSLGERGERDGENTRFPPSTNETRVGFQYPASHIGWVCCWLSFSLRGFFSGSSGSVFLPPQKTNIPNSNSTCNSEQEEPWNLPFSAWQLQSLSQTYKDLQSKNDACLRLKRFGKMLGYSRVAKTQLQIFKKNNSNNNYGEKDHVAWSSPYV